MILKSEQANTTKSEQADMRTGGNNQKSDARGMSQGPEGGGEGRGQTIEEKQTERQKG